MSLFDKLRRMPGPGEPFAPVPWSRTTAPRGTSSVFRDFGRAAPTGADAAQPAAEPVAAEAPAAASERGDLERATREAYETGVTDGRATAEEELLRLGTALADALQDVVRFRRGLRDRYEVELLELALGIARKVVQRELAEHPEHWLGMIREAIRHALDREAVRIRVGAVLHRFLVERLPTLRALLEDVKDLELVEDDTLLENGCVLESHGGDLDLSVDSQIGAIRAALTSVS